jgi:hypothetical protein
VVSCRRRSAASSHVASGCASSSASSMPSASQRADEQPPTWQARVAEAHRRLAEDWRAEVQVHAEWHQWFEREKARRASEGRRMMGKPPRFRPAPAAGAGGQDQRDRPGLAAGQEPARMGPGLHRPSRCHAVADHRRRRRDQPAAMSATGSRRWSTRCCTSSWAWNASGRTSFIPARSSAAVHAHRSVSF